MPIDAVAQIVSRRTDRATRRGRNPRTPQRHSIRRRRCRSSRHVGKRAVAVVPEQLIRSEVRQVEVDAAVVVEVPCRDAHPIPARVDAAPLGHVGEPQRARAVRVDLQIVAVEPTVERQRSFRREHRLAEGLARAQHLPLHEVDVEVAVVVVVEQPDTRRDDLGLIETRRTSR